MENEWPHFWNKADNQNTVMSLWNVGRGQDFQRKGMKANCLYDELWINKLEIVQRAAYLSYL